MNKNLETVQEAVEHLVSSMPLHDKTIIARMTLENLRVLHLSIGLYIRNEFKLWATSPF